jgi:hypothetical protein
MVAGYSKRSVRVIGMRNRGSMSGMRASALSSANPILETLRVLPEIVQHPG